MTVDAASRESGTRRRRRGVLAAVLAAVTMMSAPAARAQSAADQATAEALFKQARELMAAGKFADACPKLAESERLDPSAGTLLNLATCYDKNGLIASAWVTYKEAATAAQKVNEPDRARLARNKAAELEPKLPMLTVTVGAGADRPDLVVKRDGEAVGRAAWGTAIPVDPGQHTIQASAAGHRTWTSHVDVAGTGARVSIEVPVLPEEAAAAPVPAGPAVRPVTTGSTGSPPATPESPGSTQRVLGLVAGGAGIAGLAVGSAFGILARGHRDDAGGHCTGTQCDATGISQLDQARSAATVATIGFVAGGVLLASGIVVYLTSPRGPTGTGLVVAPGAASSFAGLTLRGGW